MRRNAIPILMTVSAMPKNGSELRSAILSKLIETAKRNATRSMYQLARFRIIDLTGSRTCSCPAEMFSTYDPLTMIQIPKNPKNDGASCSITYDVPMRNTGVNESMGTERERSEEDNALKIRPRPQILRNTVIATAGKNSGPIAGKPREAETANNKIPPSVKPIPVRILGSSAEIYFLMMMKYAALATAPKRARKIQSMSMMSRLLY
jgi:hypothetical protein